MLSQTIQLQSSNTQGEGDADIKGCGNVVRAPLRRRRKVLACKQHVLRCRNDVERVHSGEDNASSDTAHTEFEDSEVETNDENMGTLYHDLGKEGDEYNGDDEAEATVDDEVNLGIQAPDEVNMDSQVPDEVNLGSQAPDDMDGTTSSLPTPNDLPKADGRAAELQQQPELQQQQHPQSEQQQPELQQQEQPHPEHEQAELQQSEQQQQEQQQAQMQQPEMQQPEQQQPETQNGQHSIVDKYHLRTYFRRRATDNYVLGEACAGDEVDEEYEPSDELNSLGNDYSDYYDSDDFPEFDMQRDKRDPELKLFMKFADPIEVREALRLHSLIKGYSYKLVKNEWATVRAVCSSRTSENEVEEECKWVCHASWDRENKYFQIKTLVEGHTRSKPISNKNISSTWQGFHYHEAFRDDPSISADVFARMVLRDFGITVAPHSCWRASKVAKELVDGNIRSNMLR